MHTRMNAVRLMQPVTVAMRSNTPQNQHAFPAARVKHTAYASTGTTSSAQHSTRAAAAAAALFSCDPASHAPSPTNSAQPHMRMRTRVGEEDDDEAEGASVSECVTVIRKTGCLHEWWHFSTGEVSFLIKSFLV
jgi:hypothetical protein